MVKFHILVILMGGCLSSLLAAADPTIWIRLKPNADENFWLIYREEKISKLYEAANGTIIPMVICKTTSRKLVSWGISPLIRKNSQIEFDLIFRDNFGKEEKITHNFFSKGNDRKLAPLVVASDNCFEIKIPEEDGQTRNIVIRRGSGIVSFKELYKITPLMPVFRWEKMILFEM
jgi:hypothetical protein